jgi:hypothetical protein
MPAIGRRPQQLADPQAGKPDEPSAPAILVKPLQGNERACLQTRAEFGVSKRSDVIGEQSGGEAEPDLRVVRPPGARGPGDQFLDVTLFAAEGGRLEHAAQQEHSGAPQIAVAAVVPDQHGELIDGVWHPHPGAVEVDRPRSRDGLVSGTKLLSLREQVAMDLDDRGVVVAAERGEVLVVRGPGCGVPGEAVAD